jgi:hypothetical protein
MVLGPLDGYTLVLFGRIRDEEWRCRMDNYYWPDLAYQPPNLSVVGDFASVACCSIDVL